MEANMVWDFNPEISHKNEILGNLQKTQKTPQIPQSTFRLILYSKKLSGIWGITALSAGWKQVGPGI